MHVELIVTFFIFSRKAETLLTCKDSRKREISETSTSVTIFENEDFRGPL